MEATGGYEKLPFGLLWSGRRSGAIVNPRAVRRFAEAMGFLEKTDRIDAGVIAEYAGVKRIVAQEPAGEAQERLRALVTRLRQLTELPRCPDQPAPAGRGRRRHGLDRSSCWR